MEGFDHKVHHYDPKTGQMLHENHYVMRVGSEGTTYERPPGSGMIYGGDGKLIRDEKAIKAAQEAAVAAKAVEDQKVADKEAADKLAADKKAKADADAAAAKLKAGGNK